MRRPLTREQLDRLRVGEAYPLYAGGTFTLLVVADAEAGLLLGRIDDRQEDEHVYVEDVALPPGPRWGDEEHTAGVMW